MTVTVDKNKVVWIGTQNSGLVRFNGVEFITYNYNNSKLPHNQVTALAVDKNNLLWIGTYGGGIASFDGISWNKYVSFLNGNLNDYITGIKVSIDDKVWISSGSPMSAGGISSFDGIKFKNYSTVNSGLHGLIVTTLLLIKETESGLLLKMELQFLMELFGKSIMF